MRQDGRVGVGVGEADAQVDDPPAPGRLGDQVGVPAGVGHGGHGRNEGMEKRAAADVGQLADTVQLPQHGHRVGRLTAVGQPEDGSPDGPVGWPVEVGFLKHGGDLGQQASGGEDGAEDGLFGFQVVGWLAVGVEDRSQTASCRSGAWFFAGHRRGLRGPLPRRRDVGVGRRWSRTCFT